MLLCDAACCGRRVPLLLMTIPEYVFVVNSLLLSDVNVKHAFSQQEGRELIRLKRPEQAAVVSGQAAKMLRSVCRVRTAGGARMDN